MLLLPERRIQGKEHPNPDLLFYKLLYQAISRARVKLCVLVVENYKLFSDILNIKFDMLSSCLLYTSPSPRDPKTSRMPSSA